MEDVQRRSGDFAGTQPFGEGFVDDELAAGAVHDADAGLHDGDRVGVDHALGLGRQADMKGEVVGRVEDLVE